MRTTLQWMVIVALGLAAGRARPADASGISTEKEKVSYAMALAFARSVQRQGVDVDPDAFARGLREALAGGKTLMTDDEARRLLAAYQAELREKAAAARPGAVTSSGPGKSSFLAENAKREGVVTLPSGLQYKVVVAGKGERPTDADTVVCRYRGTLANGREFDASSVRGPSAKLRVSSLIPGWREALKLMPVGSTWQIFVPPELGYGRHKARKIPANSVLVFDVELLGIERQAPAGGRTAALGRASP